MSQQYKHWIMYTRPLQIDRFITIPYPPPPLPTYPLLSPPIQPICTSITLQALNPIFYKTLCKRQKLKTDIITQCFDQSATRIHLSRYKSNQSEADLTEVANQIAIMPCWDGPGRVGGGWAPISRVFECQWSPWSGIIAPADTISC